jgi:cysteine synthase A
MLPDTGERYLSTPLFAEIMEEMSDEEIALSCSTPNFRFDRPSSTPKPAAAASTLPAELDPAADDFFRQVTSDAAQPVVLFALEWCEFCWSVRKLFARLGIPYRSVDLDSVEYQSGDRGGKIRAVLKERTGVPTIPQIFVAGRHVGGATETFDAFKSGGLQDMLSAAGVSFKPNDGLDPYTLLPGWLHPRKRA